MNPDVPDVATVKADNATVEAVVAAAQTGGFRAVGARVADLQAIIERAPAGLRHRDERNGVIYYRETSMEACLIDLAGAAAQATTKDARSGKSALCLSNPYAKAALLLGSYYDEVGQPERALAELDQGLRFAPDYAGLIMERGAALGIMHRFAEELKNDQDGLEHASPFMTSREKGVLLRGQAFALTELGRLGEAEDVYRQSLKIDPGHGHAAEELRYIARLRTGAAPTATQITSGVNPAPH